MSPKPSARDQIMDTVSILFFRDGYQAVGVDTIIATAGVAKATLYRYFPSKDDLIVAYLNETNDKFWEWFNGAAHTEKTPRGAIVGVFRALEQLVTSPTCYGCPFLMVATEFPDPEHPGHQVALRHKQAVRQRLQEMAQDAGVENATQIGDHLHLLMDGAFMAVRMFGVDNPARKISSDVERLLDCANHV